MEFLVEFDISVPQDAPRSEVEARKSGETTAAAALAAQGNLLRVWKPPEAPGQTKALGLYRADSRSQLDGLLDALPLADWMSIAVTPLEPHPNDPHPNDPHPNDPADGRPSTFELPDPRLTPVYRLRATPGQPLDLGDTAQGHRRIVPLTGGTFTGPKISGTLVPGASADWQTVLPDGTALGDIRYTLRTDRGDLLDVRSRGVRHGSAEVLTRLGLGEDVDPREYTFRTSTQIETSTPDLDWLNKGIFVSVAAREAAAVVYETYLVG